jgi:phospholipid transport system substrate-binding protein
MMERIEMTNPIATAMPRRAVALGIGALWMAALLPQAARADVAADPAAVAPIERLNAGLLAVMKAGTQMAFDRRFATLAPVIDSAFDLDAVLGASVGLKWSSMPENEKSTLREAFRRYTVSSYLANFDSYSGQSFKVSPAVRNVGNGQVVVSSTLNRADGSSLKLDYVLRNGPGGWKIVDVLLDGSISRVAVQRSDFRYLLKSGGVPALTQSLTHKVASLSGGMQAS